MKKCSYINGNYFVMNYEDGTKKYKCLRLGEDFKASFPDSIDLKITNSCPYQCPYCHESSNPGGKSFNLDRTIDILDKLPKVGIELAIGGGDVLDCSDDLINLIHWCDNNNFLPRITLNSKDFFNPNKEEILDKVIYSSDSLKVGISVDSINEINKAMKSNAILSSFLVFHIIVGIFPVNELDNLFKHIDVFSILVLGFKKWGRSINKEINNLPEWKRELKRLLYKSRIDDNYGCVVGFDNLALEQLDIRSSLLDSEWNSRYMGPEFSHSMYIDAVEETFAPTSRSPKRVSWKDSNLLDYFKNNRIND